MSLPKLTVLKFGGTSVQDAQAISRLIQIVRSRTGRRLVVVSALAGITNNLLEIARLIEIGKSSEMTALLSSVIERHQKVASDLGLRSDQIQKLDDQCQHLQSVVRNLKDVSLKVRDDLVSFGELSSSILVAAALENSGQPAQWVDSRQAVRTNSDHAAAQVDFEQSRNLARKILMPVLEKSIAVAQGFIGADANGATTTLGRGGAAYSAAVFAANVGADIVEIWTDVDGILTCDPRVVPEARIIERMHFSEAAEMANLGAKVLHPATIIPALSHKIPVVILNSKNPSAKGTEIAFDETSKAAGIRGITFKRAITMVNIYSTRMLGAPGFLKSVFDVFARHRLSVDLIATSEVNISLTLDPNYESKSLQSAAAELREFSTVEIQENTGSVAVIGAGIRSRAGLGAKIFGELSDINIQMISMGASELNISLVMDSDKIDSAVRRLHKALIG